MEDSLYNEYVVSHTPYYHKEVTAARDGQAGVQPPYSIAADSYVAIGFMLCLAVSLLSMARAWRFIRFQTRNLLRMPRESSFEMRETLDEMQYMAYFWLQGTLLYAVLTYNVTREFVGTEYEVGNYTLMAVYGCITALYFILRSVLNLTVLPVFFDKSSRHLVGISRTFLVAMQGALMLPIMLLNVYAGLSTRNTLYVALGMLLIVVLLRFYKVFQMFFYKKGRFLQFFLYLCTLEAVPFVLVMGALLFAANYLKVNI